MKHEDYTLLINICQHAIRKGTDLNQSQIADIDRMIRKLYNEQQSRRKVNVVVRDKKVGKRSRV
jgi:hypothetical protein